MAEGGSKEIFELGAGQEAQDMLECEEQRFIKF
jgi:hypothetical protein